MRLSARPAAYRDTMDFPIPDFVDLQKNSTLFESFIIDRITGTTLSVGDRAERASVGIVSAELFRCTRSKTNPRSRI